MHHLSIISGPRDRQRFTPPPAFACAKKSDAGPDPNLLKGRQLHCATTRSLCICTHPAHTIIAYTLANMASSNNFMLTADEIDDVLYFTRVNEASDLQATIAELAQKYNRAPREIVEAAVDAESGNGALHYCAANGLAGTWKQQNRKRKRKRKRKGTTGSLVRKQVNQEINR
jgi:hypothetical protein